MAEDEAVIDSDALHLAMEELGVEGGLDDRTRAQLTSIERAICEELRLREQARAEMLSHNLSVASIAEASGVSRASIYNKDVLRQYLRRRVENLQVDRDERRLRRLQEQLTEAHARVEALERRDGELVLAKMEIERLKKQLESARKAGVRGRRE